jgi:hypothetical protein
MKAIRFTFVPLVCFLMVLGITVAQAGGSGFLPHLINYQGVLTDPSGAALSGVYHMHFRAYTHAAGGSLFWEEEQDATVVSGVFNVILGSVTSIPYDLFRLPPLYLEVQVGMDPPMTPRRQFTSTASAFMAGFCGIVFDNPTNYASTEIPVPHYRPFQISISELAGTSDNSAWISAGENDRQLSYVGFSGAGTVVHGTCSFYTTCTILTVQPGLTLRTKGDGTNTLVLDSSGYWGESKATLFAPTDYNFDND